MAKSKKSLKSLFSRSELNLKDSSEKDESSARSKTLKFFTWRKKKKTTGATDRTESPDPSVEDWPDSDQRTSIYATAPRSKGLLSKSETDLHKRKGFTSFSLGWRKKKKKIALAQSVASIDTEPDANDQTREQQNEEQEDMEENVFSQEAQSEVVKPASTHRLPSFIFTDQLIESEGVPEGPSPASAPFTPVTLDGTFISYIDSDSDGYHTPPESPDMDAMAFFHAQTDNNAIGHSLDESVGTSFSLYPETNEEITPTTKFDTPKSQESNISTRDFTTDNDDMVQAVLRTMSFPKSPLDNSSAVPASGVEVLSVIERSSKTLMKGQEANTSTSAYSLDHSTTLQQAHDWTMTDKALDNITIPDSASTISGIEEADSSQGHTESNNPCATVSTSVLPQNSTSRPAMIPTTKQSSSQATTDKIIVEQIDCPSKIGPTEMSTNNSDSAIQVPKPELSSSTKQESSDPSIDAGPGWALHSIGEAFGDSVVQNESDSFSKSENLSVSPEVISSTTEASAVNTPNYSTDSKSTAVKPVCYDVEHVQLQNNPNISSNTGNNIKTSDSGSPYTTKTNLSSTMMYGSSDHNPSHGWASSSSGDSVLKEESHSIPKSLDIPVLSELISSNIELSSFSIECHNSKDVSIGDTSRTSTEYNSTDVPNSNQPILASVEQASHGLEPDQLQNKSNIFSVTGDTIKILDSGSSYTTKTNETSTESCSNNVTNSNQPIFAAVEQVFQDFEPAQIQDSNLKSNISSTTLDPIRSFDSGSPYSAKTNLSSTMMLESSDHNSSHGQVLSSSGDSIQLEDNSNISITKGDTILNFDSGSAYTTKQTNLSSTGSYSTDLTISDKPDLTADKPLSHGLEPAQHQDTNLKSAISSTTVDPIKTFDLGSSYTAQTNLSSTMMHEISDHNPSHSLASSTSSDSVLKEESNFIPKSLDIPVLPEVISSNTKLSSFSIARHNSEEVSPVDSSRINTESNSTDVTDSNQPIRTVVKPVYHDFEPAQLKDKSNISITKGDTITTFDSGSSYTTKQTNLSSTESHSTDLTISDKTDLTAVKPASHIQDKSSMSSTTGETIKTLDSGSSYNTKINLPSTMMYTDMAGRDHHSRKKTDLAEQVPPEPDKVCTGLPSETFNINKSTPNTSSLDNVPTATNLLPTHPDIHHHPPSGLTERQEVNMDTQNNMRTNKAGESHAEEQILSQGQDEFVDCTEPAWKSVTNANDSESVDSLTAKSVQKKYSGIENPVKNLDEFTDHDKQVWKSVTLANDSKSVDSLTAKSVQKKYIGVDTSNNTLNEVQLTSSEKGKIKDEHLPKNQDQESTIVKQVPHKSEASFKAQQFGEVQDQLGRESKILESEAAQQLSHLAITKPDTPVLRERVLEECTTAAPWSPHGEASITDCSLAAHTDLGAGYSPSLAMLSGGAITLQQHSRAGGGAKGSAVSLHAEKEDRAATQEQVTLSDSSRASRTSPEDLKVRTGEGKESDYRRQEVPDTSSLFRSSYTAEKTLQSKTIRDTLEDTPVPVPPENEDQDRYSAAGTQHQPRGGLSPLSLYSEAASANTVETSRTLTERGTSTSGVIVYLREFGLDNSEEEDGGQSTRTRAIPDQIYIPAGQFSHAFSVLSTVAEESDSEIPVDSSSESDSEMSSGIGVLSTTLTLKPKGSVEGREDGKRVHKVSLVSNSSSNNISSNSSSISSSGVYSAENGLRDEIKTNGSNHDNHESLSAWTSRREELNSTTEDSTSSVLERSRLYDLSDKTYLYSSSLSSSSYEPTPYSTSSSSSSYSYSSYSSMSSEAPPSSVSIDTTDSLGNSSWGNLRSEVQQSSESEVAGRRRWEEPVTPAGEGGITNTGSDSHAQQTEQSDSYFSGVFKATRVELPSSPTDALPDLDPDTSMPASPHDMDTLLDTLKSMGPPVRHRTLRNSSSQPFSSLPPIVEDAPSPSSAPLTSPTSPEPKPLSSLPPDLGLNWSSMKDMRSPLTMMKEQQASELPSRNLILPSRASTISSIVMRKSSLPDLTSEDGALTNGGGSLLGPSRLDNSLIFSNYRSEHDGSQDGKGLGSRSLFRTASLPEVSSGLDRLSMPPKSIEQLGSGTSRFDRLSFLTSPPGSLTGLNEMSSRMSVSPSFLQNNGTVASPPFNHTPPSSLELFRTLSPESPVKHQPPPSLQRSLSSEGHSVGSPVFNGAMRGFGAPQEQAPERNFTAKYRAFPDAYLTKEKEHGKLNPRPGKMFVFNRPGLRGQRTEIRGDVMDATAWQFPECISIRVVRGGWVLYEKPDFKGEKIALDEGDIELTYPWGPAEDEHGHMQNGTQGSEEDQSEPKPPARRQFIIGSLRRAVRDYSVPEICLFPEENAEGKKIVFRDTSEDARIFGFPIKANSIIINAGLWLVFAEPFFQGDPRVLEVGGFSNPAAWGVTQPYVSSLHPLKIGEPKVEKPNEPKLVIFEKPYFTGKSREIFTNSRDFMSRESNQQQAFMFNAGSIKVIGGIWVGYEKEGFRGHQYLLEEGEYHDWRVWGGCDSELRSVRAIRTDLSQPTLVMFEMTTEEEEQEQEERTFEVTEAVPDVELFGFRPATRSIHVLSGAWVAYSHVDYSGHQFVLEKGFYNNCADWGSEDNRICSIQPILQAPANGPSIQNELLLYSEPGFQGKCQAFTLSHDSLPESLPVQSCRVVGGSWVLYDDINYMGNQYVLSEGDYANFISIGCPANYSLRSIKSVPMMFSVPSISMFGLECFEGREVTVESEVSNMIEEGFNPHVLSVRVNSGCWVLCEHTNYRGRQYLLEPIEITNWHKFSSLSTIGSMYPIRAKRKPFRIRYRETGHYMSVQGGVDTMKSGRVVVSEQVEGMSDIWFYQDGLLKNKLAPTMSLQVMGSVESGAKVVLWSETRTPVQRWSAQLSGAISSLTFPGLVLDVKGGKTYDKEHVIVQSEGEEGAAELWELELL